MYYRFKGSSKKSHVIFKDKYGYRTFCGFSAWIDDSQVRELHEPDNGYACSCYTCRTAYEKVIKGDKTK